MRGRGLFLLAALSVNTLTLSTPALSEEPFSFAATPGTLPKRVRPLAYRIDIAPDLARLAIANGKEDIGFTGKVEIDLDVLEPTDSLTLNAQALTFDSVTVGGVPATVTLDTIAQTARLQWPSRLPAGQHTLTASYAGKITSDPTGFYYMKYDTPQGERRMLSTQMQPGYARRMFPGWDEPVFKATFRLSAVVPESFRAVSNTPVAGQEPAGSGKIKVTFATTPMMSSYLVVLSAGELGRLQRTVNGIDVGIMAPQDRIEKGRYALDASAQVLGYLSDYFGIPYPLPKLDHIAVPGAIDTFSAMENWGASTYVEDMLLFDPASSSQQTREDIFIMLAHETAHQWFGNLVTPAWWDNLWLNEGFATWMERKVADHFNPTWKIALRAHSIKESVMRSDAVRTSHPVQQEVADAQAARTAFDTITYDKGYAFIRMLEAFVGEEKFRTGLRAYMRKHTYSSTTTADLWAALTEASGVPITEIAASFIDQPGIPLIHVSTRCVNDWTEVTLRQDRFSLNNPYAEKRTWKVPVNLGQRLKSWTAVSSVLVTDTPAKVEFFGCGWPVKANLGNAGYYRTQYDDDAFKALAADFRQLHAADRVNLLSDTWAMVQAGRADIGRYLDLTASLGDEPELAVWQSVTETLEATDRVLIGSKTRDAFHAYARDLIRPLQARLGFDPKPDDSAETLLLRVMAIENMGHFRDQAVIAEARRRFWLFVQKPESLNPELLTPVANVVGGAADRKAFDALLKMARSATSSEDKMRYYFAAASASDPALGTRAIELARTENLPTGRLAYFINQVVLRSDEPDRIWALVLKQQKTLLARATESERETLLAYAARPSSNPRVAYEVKWADASRASKGAQSEADKSADFIELRADIKPRVVPAVDAWLKARK